MAKEKHDDGIVEASRIRINAKRYLRYPNTEFGKLYVGGDEVSVPTELARRLCGEGEYAEAGVGPIAARVRTEI